MDFGGNSKTTRSWYLFTWDGAATLKAQGRNTRTRPFARWNGITHRDHDTTLGNRLRSLVWISHTRTHATDATTHAWQPLLWRSSTTIKSNGELTSRNGRRRRPTFNAHTPGNRTTENKKCYDAKALVVSWTHPIDVASRSNWNGLTPTAAPFVCLNRSWRRRTAVRWEIWSTVLLLLR